MKDLFIVAKFTIKDMVKRKSFIISNLIILAIIVLLFNVPKIMDFITGDKDTFSKTSILIVDSENIFQGTLQSLNQQELGYDVKVSNDKLIYDDIKEKINNEEVKEAIIITSEQDKINMEYIVENLSMIEKIPEKLVNALTTLFI